MLEKKQQQQLQTGSDIREEDKMVFGNESTETRCPFCGTQTLTEISFNNGLLTYILVFISLLILGVFFSMIAIPLIFVFTKQLVHKCASCEQEIGSNDEIIFGSGIKDGIVSLKVGEIGCILTRKIFITTIAGIFAVLILYYKISTMSTTRSYGHSHMHDKIVYTNTTWDEFIDDCGINKITTHEKFHQCERSYIDKSVVDWQGYIIRVEDYRQTMYQYLHHAVSILVKLNDKDSDSHADVLLTFDSEMADIFEEQLNNITRGEHIGFNATIKSIGNPQQTRHFHALSIWKEEGFIEIPAHIHDGGRYDDTPRRMRGKATKEQPQALKQMEKDEEQEQKLADEMLKTKGDPEKVKEYRKPEQQKMEEKEQRQEEQEKNNQ